MTQKLIQNHSTNILSIQVCPSSPIQTNYVSVEHKGIQDWVTTFVKATNLSGLVCFDFLVDNNDNAYCIECNPRLHSAIVSFESQTKVIIEHVVLSASFKFNAR